MNKRDPFAAATPILPGGREDPVMPGGSKPRQLRAHALAHLAPDDRRRVARRLLGWWRDPSGRWRN